MNEALKTGAKRATRTEANMPTGTPPGGGPSPRLRDFPGNDATGKPDQPGL